MNAPRPDPPVLIRLLGAGDAVPYQALRLRGLAEEATAFASSWEEERDRPIEDVRSQLAPTDHGAILGAFDGDRLLGVVGIERERMKKLSHKGCIWGMYIAPEGRAQRVGTRLMQAALDHAWSELHLAQVNLGVHTKNLAALRVYTALGFEIFGTERGALCVDGKYQDEHHMVCWAPGTRRIR